MNLCIRNKETKELGIDRHVCELQLSLRAFASLVVCVARQTRARAFLILRHMQRYTAVIEFAYCSSLWS